MSNPWGVNLKKTGLREQRTMEDEMARQNLENRQSELAASAAINKENKEIYDDRQASLAASAMMGQQDRLGGKKKRKTRKHKSKKSRKSRKSRRHRRR